MPISLVRLDGISGNELLAIGVLEELEEQDLCHSILFRYSEGRWTYSEYLNRVIGAHLVGGETKKLMSVAIGYDGSYVVRSSQEDERRNRIRAGSPSPSNLRRLTASRRIGKRIYVCGMGRTVFSAPVLADDWRREDDGVVTSYGSTELVGFTNIDGFSSEELYCCGLRGDVFVRRDDAWYSVDAPTNMTFSALRCTEAGKVYVGGTGGLMLTGRGMQWEVMQQDLTTAGIIQIEVFGDEIYALTQRWELLRFRNDDVSLVDFKTDKPFSPICMTIAGSELFVAGGRTILKKAGEGWSEVESPIR